MSAVPAPSIKKRAKAPKAKAEKKGKEPKEKKEKKAPGPYMLFCKETRPKIVKENPDMAFGEVGKALGAAWGKLSAKDKAAYKKD